MQTLELVPKDKLNNLAPLLKGWDDGLIFSVLHGYTGSAWVDDINEPTITQINGGYTSFFAGKAKQAYAEIFLKNIPPNYPHQAMELVALDSSWYKYIEEVYAGRFNKYKRYALKKDSSFFDREKLKGFVNALPKEYELVKTGENERDIGYEILQNKKSVCKASSCAYYDKGIEVDIETNEVYRRKGLATVCAAQLILYCLVQGLHPSWDAANRESLSLAKKLGYQFDREYDAYDVQLGE